MPWLLLGTIVTANLFVLSSINFALAQLMTYIARLFLLSLA